MVDQVVLEREFFELLEAYDEAITGRVAAEGCPVCDGPLYRGDYDRKPRGGLIARTGEEFVRRFSLCCGREGCRRRATPPSLRFLGRRVYLGAVVILASLVAHALGVLTTVRSAKRRAAMKVRAATGVPARTTRRWLGWWRGPFLSTEVFVSIRARLVGVDVAQLPASILDRLPGKSAEQVRALLTLLAPLTTGSIADGARFVRAAG
ncbi:MAG TPA: hypothetical protein VNV44_13760 [Solirubrobacteraceae bacterium]|jgi:hypothetical protein|nr:hypothetical protein [Solirubrobacteraceae bacterium]